jgi:hypothetical protein
LRFFSGTLRFTIFDWTTSHTAVHAVLVGRSERERLGLHVELDPDLEPLEVVALA